MPTPDPVFSGALAPEPVLHLDEAIARMGDREIYLEIAHYFAGRMRETLGELLGKLNDGDMENATRLAHSLKGNCATIGAEELRTACLALERLCREERREQALAAYAELVPKLLTLRETLLQLE